MFKRMSVALLAGASCLVTGLHQAAAIETAPRPERTLSYAGQPAQRTAAPVRTAYAVRSNMGGGFIEFLFGDGQSQGGRYQQQPYQQQPSYDQRPLFPPMEPQQEIRQQEVAGAYPAFDPGLEKERGHYHRSRRPGTVIV